MNLNIFAISSLLVLASNTFISFIVFRLGKEKKYNRILSCFCLAVALWGLGSAMFATTNSMQIAFLWWRIAYIGVIFAPILYLHFILSFLERINKSVLCFGYILCTFFFILDFFFADVFFTDMQIVFNSFYYHDWIANKSKFFILFIFYFYSCGIYALYLHYKSFARSKGTIHTQLKYLLIGATIGWIGTIGDYLPEFRLQIYPYSNFLIAVYPFIWAYAIFRHRLLVDIVFKRGIIYSVAVSILTSSYIFLIYMIEKMFKNYTGYNSTLITIILFITFVLFFQPLKDIIRKILDKSFFRASIDQIEQENIRLREELQKSEKLRAVATLAAGMAHEIKNPLTSIKTFTEYIDKKKDDPGFIKKFKKIVGEEVDRINYIVKQLLEFSKPSKLQLRETEIHELLNETLNLLNNDLLKHNIKVIKYYTSPTLTKIDPAQMKQVFLNIFLNAIDAMNSSGVLTITTQIIDKHDIVIAIQDTGKGIAKEDLKHIFDPFFSKKDGGTGLGLSVVHGIIKKHDGKIMVKSIPRTGTLFEILLQI